MKPLLNHSCSEVCAGVAGETSKNVIIGGDYCLWCLMTGWEVGGAIYSTREPPTHASEFIRESSCRLSIKCSRDATWRLFMCVTSGYLSTVHRPDNEVILLHVPEAVGSEADKNSQCTMQCQSHKPLYNMRGANSLFRASPMINWGKLARRTRFCIFCGFKFKLKWQTNVVWALKFRPLTTLGIVLGKPEATGSMTFCFQMNIVLILMLWFLEYACRKSHCWRKVLVSSKDILLRLRNRLMATGLNYSAWSVPASFADFILAEFSLPFLKSRVPDLTISLRNELISCNTGLTAIYSIKMRFLVELSI